MYERLERSRNNAWIAIPIDGGGPGNFDADRVYVFFVFCYHLKDWIKNDTSVPEAVRSQVETFVKNTPSLALAGDLANGVKHLARDRPARVDAAARIDVRGPTLSRDHYASGRPRPSLAGRS
jgi:hypothetical protein